MKKIVNFLCPTLSDVAQIKLNIYMCNKRKTRTTTIRSSNLKDNNKKFHITPKLFLFL